MRRTIGSLGKGFDISMHKFRHSHMRSASAFHTPSVMARSECLSLYCMVSHLTRNSTSSACGVRGLSTIFMVILFYDGKGSLSTEPLLIYLRSTIVVKQIVASDSSLSFQEST